MIFEGICPAFGKVDGKYNKDNFQSDDKFKK